MIQRVSSWKRSFDERRNLPPPGYNFERVLGLIRAYFSESMQAPLEFTMHVSTQAIPGKKRFSIYHQQIYVMN